MVAEVGTFATSLSPRALRLRVRLLPHEHGLAVTMRLEAGTGSRGDAEGKGHLAGKLGSHRLVNGSRRSTIRDRLLSRRSPRLRVRILPHGYGLATPESRRHLRHMAFGLREQFHSIATEPPKIVISRLRVFALTTPGISQLSMLTTAWSVGELDVGREESSLATARTSSSRSLPHFNAKKRPELRPGRPLLESTRTTA